MAITRRMFVGGSAAALGAVAGGPGIARAGSTEDTRELDEVERAALTAPLLVKVVDAEEGVVRILVGEEAVEFTDKQLVRRIGRAALEGNS